MEAAGCSYAEDAARKFNSLSDELTKLLHGRREGDKEYINALFDELNALNYKLPIVTNPEKALLLLHQCCSLVPPDDTFLAAKASQLTTRLVAQAARRGVRPEGATLSRALRWTTDAVRSTALLATPDVLGALEALLRANAARLERPLELAGLLAPLLAPERPRSRAGAGRGAPAAAPPPDPAPAPAPPPAPTLRCLTPPPAAETRRDLRARALRCLEALLAPSSDAAGGAAGARAPRPGDEPPPPEVLAACERAFEDALREPPNYRDPDDAGSVQRSQTLAVALRGLRSAVARSPSAPNDERLGQMLALATAYMAHGLLPPDSYPPPPPPPRLYPSSLPPGPVPRAPPPGPDRPQPAKTVRMRNKFKKADPGRHGGDEAEGDGGGGGGGSGGGAPWGWSDSETSSGGSDSEGGGGAGGGGGRAAAAARVRLAAVLLVLSLTWRADRRALLAYWPWLLAIEPLQVNCGTLARAATRDPSARVRAEAAAALSAVLMGARPFLRLAENRDRARDGDAPFTAFSAALGGALRDLHRELGGTLFREEVPAAATQLLRCLAQLAQQAPYRRLVPGLPATAARHARPFTQHRDAAVQVASFTALRSVAAADAPEAELLAALRYLPRPAAGPDALPDAWRPDALGGQDQNREGDDDEEEWEEEVAPDEEGESDGPADLPNAPAAQAEAEAEAAREALARGLRPGPEARARPCWLVAACLRRLAPGADATPVLRIECLQTLRAVAARFFAPLLQPHLHSALLPALLRCLASDDDPALAQGDGASANSGGSGALRLHAARVLEALALALAKEEGERALGDARAFWGRLLAVRRPAQAQTQTQAQPPPPPLAPLPQLLAAADPAERAAALDLLAAMHDAAYAALPRREQVLALALAPGALADADAAVRAAAARALGLSAAFREPRASPDFLWTLAERLGDALLHDASAAARARAAWALAEVSDALVEDAPAHGIPDCADLLRLLQAAHRGAVDSDKVRSHAVRAAGNALRLLPAHTLEEDGAGAEAAPEAERALEALARAADAGAFMKARWNACYALANAARNPALFAPRPRWQDAAFTTLLRLVQRCSNFKVRKAAAAALAAAAAGMSGAEAEAGVGTARQRFGSQLVPAWKALLAAMERACAPTDPEEAAHRDALLEQLALAAAAVAAVAASGSTPGELEALREAADARAEVTRAAAEAALRARPPERATPLLAAAEALRARARDSGPARAHALALRALFLPGGDALNLVLSADPGP